VSGDIRTGVALNFRNRLAGALLVCGLALLAPVAAAQAPAAAPQSGDFKSRHEALSKRQDLQFRFSEPEPVDLRRDEPDRLSWLDSMMDGLQPVLNAVFWIALAAGGIALLAFVGREVLAGRPGQNLKPKERHLQETDFRPEEGRARALLAEADALAAEGRFTEAVRTLLHRSINDIEERAPNSIRKAQTSREISRMPVLPEAVRAAFAPITRAVEESWFGGRPINAQRYQDCRKAYADFALAETWSGVGPAGASA
jgi:uncharacterized protein DUF4129